jgi:hypothetical protein
VNSSWAPRTVPGGRNRGDRGAKLSTVHNCTQLYRTVYCVAINIGPYAASMIGLRPGGRKWIGMDVTTAHNCVTLQRCHGLFFNLSGIALAGPDGAAWESPFPRGWPPGAGPRGGSAGANGKLHRAGPEFGSAFGIEWGFLSKLPDSRSSSWAVWIGQTAVASA